MRSYTNEFYIGTILEGIPVNFRYHELQPKHIYKVKDNSITFHKYPKWYPLPENPTVKRMQVTYLHDMSHAILYYTKGQNTKIFKNDFGLNWKYVHHFGDNRHFSNPEHLADEYKILALHAILRRICWNKKTYTRAKLRKMIYEDTAKIWHTKRIYKDGKLNPRVIAEKQAQIKAGIDYWYDMGIPTVKKHITEFVKFLQSKNLQTEY